MLRLYDFKLDLSLYEKATEIMQKKKKKKMILKKDRGGFMIEIMNVTSSQSICTPVIFYYNISTQPCDQEPTFKINLNIIIIP